MKRLDCRFSRSAFSNTLLLLFVFFALLISLSSKGTFNNHFHFILLLALVLHTYLYKHQASRLLQRTIAFDPALAVGIWHTLLYSNMGKLYNDSCFCFWFLFWWDSNEQKNWHNMLMFYVDCYQLAQYVTSIGCHHYCSVFVQKHYFSKYNQKQLYEEDHHCHFLY